MEEEQEPQEALRGLKDRLRSFLDHVAQLQRENLALQERLEEFGRRSGQQDLEWGMKERAVGQLREQITQLLIENAELALQTENTKSSVSRLQSRCEAEERHHLRLEQRVSELLEKKTDIDSANDLLEKQLHTLRLELQLLEDEQEEQADGLLAQAAAEEEDGRGMELRRPRRVPHPAPGLRPAPPTRTWKDTAVPIGDPLLQVSRGDEALKEARAELTEVRMRWHSLQVEIESLHALERGLQSSLLHTQQHYSQQLQDLSLSVRGLEEELGEVREGLSTQRQQHLHLLNTKMRLEREIATYRRLLELEEGRYLGGEAPPRRLKPWRCPAPQLLSSVYNGCVENGDVTILTEEPANQEPPLQRQGSLVILTEPMGSREGEISTVKTQEILDGTVLRESAEGHGRVETEKIDKVIRQWEGSFFKGNPKLRKKCVSLRFDLHMAAADEGCAQIRQDTLPDVEVRLVMKRSRSIPSMTQ